MIQSRRQEHKEKAIAALVEEDKEAEDTWDKVVKGRSSTVVKEVMQPVIKSDMESISTHTHGMFEEMRCFMSLVYVWSTAAVISEIKEMTKMTVQDVILGVGLYRLFVWVVGG